MEHPCGSCHESVYDRWCQYCVPTPNPKKWKWGVLNPVQAAALKALQENPKANLIVSTGTGTGKTACAEFAIDRLVPPAKAVVMEPLKALAHEKVADWSKRFPHLEFVELTSDAEIGVGKERNAELMKYDVVVCSYEMLESMTRKPETYTILSKVALLVIDEVHELGDVSRGGPLDGALTRFLMAHKPQVIALSATFDNVGDLRDYLRQFVPVQVIALPFAPILVHVKPSVVPYPPRGRDGVMVREILSMMDHCEGGILAMCLSIPSVDAIAGELNALRPGLALAHYSEMSAEDRHQAEDTYRAQTAKVIVSTPTLLAGVNIPAQGIVLDISFFDQDSHTTQVLPITKIRQAVGRVGRLPWYKEGYVTYICQGDVMGDAVSELATPMVVKGTLFNSADSVLNTEIQLARVMSRRSLLEWYSHTYSRFSNGLTDEEVRQLFSDEVEWLETNGFVKVEDRVTGRLRGTFRGLVAHQHFLRPRWLADAERFLENVSENGNEDDLECTINLLDVLAAMSSSRYSPINWNRRKTNSALRIMGYEQMIDDGRIDWSSREANYQWIRDAGDNLNRLSSGLARLRGTRLGGFQALSLLATCFARGCVPPKLARLSRLLTSAGVKGLGYKRLLFLYANGLTAQSVVQGAVPKRFGLPSRCSVGSVIEAEPGDFSRFSPDYTPIMPEKLLRSVLESVGRQAV